MSGSIEDLRWVESAEVWKGTRRAGQLAFAYLTCNGDAHAKNFSIRQAPDGEWEATPAYDVPSSHPYGDHTMALAINGKTREDIGRADFLALG